MCLLLPIPFRCGWLACEYKLQYTIFVCWLPHQQLQMCSECSWQRFEWRWFVFALEDAGSLLIQGRGLLLSIGSQEKCLNVSVDLILWGLLLRQEHRRVESLPFPKRNDTVSQPGSVCIPRRSWYLVPSCTFVALMSRIVPSHFYIVHGTCSVGSFSTPSTLPEQIHHCHHTTDEWCEPL